MARPTQFKIDLSAPTKKELSKQMLLNNIKFNAYLVYTAPTFQEGEWTTWFEVDVETHLELIKEYTTAPVVKKGKK